MKTTWVKQGDVRKVCSKKPANIRKGEGNKIKTTETKNNNVFEKGLIDKNKEKHDILKGKTKGKPKNKTE